ncbi:CmcI family methyltransferase [Christiangramia marina]|uniref:CmcI family methyltransferase n=1 Tax=Christiangramia marina TaxID=409436 RepID=UPI003AA924DF
MQKIFFVLKRYIPLEKRLKLRYKFRYLLSLFYFRNLSKMALIHKTDKFGTHFYTPHYQRHFRKYRFKKINLFEIGVGGYDNPYIGGNSLRMWKSFFPFARIFSIDLYDKSFLQENRIKLFQGSQVDEEFLYQVVRDIKKIDIIIDDGSHLNEHVISTFKLLFPKLKIGGYYVIEDTQTSYWENYGGSSKNLNKEGTVYTFFKGLIDSLNHEEFILENYEKSYYDKHIIAIHFYHNLIFIEKGVNNEHSNKVRNNQFK